MCIIIQGTSANLRRVLTSTVGLIESVYDYNSDGLGIMFPSNDGAPVALKTLPTTAEDARVWLSTHLPDDNRSIALHARFTTHGKTDMDNCHPYDLDGGYMMHNGVLATGNKADPSKSDTWHYCRQFLDGQADAVFASETGRALLGDHIGDNNRFVFLGKDGQIYIVNRDTGVEYEGLWFSNTYAWDVSTLDPTWRKFSKSYRRGDPRAYSGYDYGSVYGAGSYTNWRDDDCLYGDEEFEGGLASWQANDGSYSWLMNESEELLETALNDCGVDLIRELVEELGVPTVEQYAMSDPELDFDKAAKAIEDGAYALLTNMIDTGRADAVADALIYAMRWPEIADATPESPEFEDVPELGLELDVELELDRATG